MWPLDTAHTELYSSQVFYLWLNNIDQQDESPLQLQSTIKLFVSIRIKKVADTNYIP